MSNTRSATGRPAPPLSRSRAPRRPRGPRRRPRRARRRAPRTARRPGRRGRRARGAAARGRARSGPTMRTSPVPGARPGRRTRGPGGRPTSARTGGRGSRTRPGRGTGHIGATAPGARERRIEPEGELLGRHRGPMVARPFQRDRLGPTGRAPPSGRRHARPLTRRRSPRPSTRRSPCPEPHAPTTCTASPSRPSPPVARRHPRRVHGQASRARQGRLPAVDLVAPTDGSEPARQLTLGDRRTARRGSRPMVGRSRSSAIGG